MQMLLPWQSGMGQEHEAGDAETQHTAHGLESWKRSAVVSLIASAVLPDHPHHSVRAQSRLPCPKHLRNPKGSKDGAGYVSPGPSTKDSAIVGIRYKGSCGRYSNVPLPLGVTSLLV